MNIWKTQKSMENPKLIGRPLLVLHLKTYTWRFIRRSDIPPEEPCVFIAREPFTVLGIDPRTSRATIANLARQKQQEWIACMASKSVPARHRHAMTTRVDQAVAILTQDCLRYRAFARHYRAQLTQITPERIQKKVFHAILNAYPKLGKRDALHQMKGGGIFSGSMLAAAVLAIVVMSMPVGGFTLFGFTLFATTITASWGPLAFFPSLTIALLGAVGAYYYRRHRNVFREMRNALSFQLAYLEEVARSLEDHFMLALCASHKKENPAYVAHLKDLREYLPRQMDIITTELVNRALARMAEVAAEISDSQRLTADTFLEGLGRNPELMREALGAAVTDQIEKWAGQSLNPKKEE